MDDTGYNVERLLDDAAYLQEEAEALKYVIIHVPYADRPPSGESILEMLARIDFAQNQIYRPAIERIIQEAQTPDLTHLDEAWQHFSFDHENQTHADPVLDAIISNRSSLMQMLRNIQATDWQRHGIWHGRNKTLAEWVEDMVAFDRQQLKNVADQVMTIDNQQNTQS